MDVFLDTGMRCDACLSVYHALGVLQDLVDLRVREIVVVDQSASRPNQL